MDDESHGDTRPARVGAPLWPALVAVVAIGSLPYVSFLAANVGDDPVLGTVALWWVSTVGVGSTVVLLGRIVGSSVARTVAVLVCILTWAVLHAHVLETWRTDVGAPLDRRPWWIALTVVAVAAGAAVAARPAAQTIAFAVAPALLLVPAVEGVTALVDARGAPAADVDAAAPPDTDRAFVRRPDVWLFVLDGHGDADLLRRRTAYDPEPFLSSLAERGFTVVEGARSNYPVTHLSVSSTLQMELVAPAGRAPGPAGFRAVLGGDNRAVDTFRANGYAYAHSYPGVWTDSACGGREDVCLGDEVGLSETSLALASRTPLAGEAWLYGDVESVAVANDPAAVVEDALDDLDGDRPVLGFVHVLPPHPPYLRDAGCGLVSRSIFGLREWGDGREYGDAVACLHDQLERAVDLVLARDPDAVVVLLGDHGPRFDTDLAEAQVLDDPAMFPVLHATRQPAGCTPPPDGTTNVNALRVVLACLTDTPLDLLPDEQVLVEYPTR